MDEKDRIREIADKREIPHLCHFTRIENIESILKNGLLSVCRQDEMKVQSIRNDMHRIDGQLSATSLSIEHPNYKMFYPLRLNQPESQWVVVALYSRVLWEKDCAFMPVNAASGSVITRPVEEFMTADAPPVSD